MKVILSIVIALFIIGCSEEATTEVKAVDTEKINVVEEKSALDKATDKVSEAKDDLKSKVLEAKETVVEKANEVKEDITEKVTETKASVSDTTTEVVASIKDTVASVTEEEIDAEALYGKCSICHGQDGGRAEIGKAMVIKRMAAGQIEHALLGYKNDTYGRTMKAMMKQQVMNLSDAEIKALAKYIAE